MFEVSRGREALFQETASARSRSEQTHLEAILLPTSMMLLWICLLIGAITCSPVDKIMRAGVSAPSGTSYLPSSYPAAASPWDSGSSNLGSGSSLPSSIGAPHYAVSGAGPVYSSPSVAEGSTGGYVSFGPEVYSQPEVGEYGVAYAPSGGYEGGASGGSYGGGYGGEGSYGYASAPAENWGSGSAAGYGASVEQPQAVFSDVSGLDPVYGFSSRSSYQRGRSVVSQARYTPRAAGQPAAPVYRPLIRTPVAIQTPVLQAPVKQHAPVKAMTKGGY